MWLYYLLLPFLLSGCLAFGSGFVQGLADGTRDRPMSAYERERIRLEQERLYQETWRNHQEERERIRRRGGF